jgi:ribulose 1,5-bisphosphate synthetase/thiazole synthase
MTIQDNSIPAPPSQVDVLIVGGGPVGLLAANLLVQAGMTVRILGNSLVVVSVLFGGHSSIFK